MNAFGISACSFLPFNPLASDFPLAFIAARIGIEHGWDHIYSLTLQHQLFTSGPHGDHLGLAGIAKRVRELGGAAWFERGRGGGVKLRVEVPLGGADGVA